MQDDPGAVIVWKSEDMKDAPVGEGMLVSDVVGEMLPNHHAGYVDVHGGKLSWREEGTEMMWLLEGEITISHDTKTYLLRQGDMVLLGNGACLDMEGTSDARVAYFVVPASS